MIDTQMISPAGTVLTDEQILETLHKGLDGRFRNQRLLVLIPDHTRSLPLPFLFRALVEVLHNTTHLDFMVALGTHPPLNEENLNKLVGITAEERSMSFQHIGLLNHAWDQPSALTSLGVMEQDEIKQIAGDNWHSSLPNEVDICINKAALEYDHIVILGPTFPHEVAGFSGGAKYLFPGISGAEMINATHWLGALAGVVGTIGIQETPVRTMIHAAAARLQTPLTLVALVVEGKELSGLFIGDHVSAWNEAAELSDIVVVSVPYAAHRETLESVKDVLKGKILIDVTAPLVSPKNKVQMPPAGSAAQEAKEIVGEGVEVVAAFQTIPYEKLLKDEEIDCDVLVTGTSKDARSEVLKLVEAAGLIGWDAGPIVNSVVAEGLASVLININRQYGSTHSGIKITGANRKS